MKHICHSDNSRASWEIMAAVQNNLYIRLDQSLWSETDQPFLSLRIFIRGQGT